MILLSVAMLVILVFFWLLHTKKIVLDIWSIAVFKSQNLIFKLPHEKKLDKVTLCASDILDVHAEFVADPFIIFHNSFFYMFFEIMDKSSGKGIIGLATSKDGEEWKYDRVVLRENYHLSFPYVFKHKGEYYMIPESCEANQVFLYKAKNFPYEWNKVNGLVKGKYVDSSIFYYNNKWWMFAGESGNLHLFYSERLEEDWEEHPKSPMISNNYNITRSGGRVIVDSGKIYRYTQDCKPNYGSAVRVFEITQLSERDYLEEEVNLVLRGSNRSTDWNRDGMHNIDQLKLVGNNWLIAVDGHKSENKSYLLWKLDRVFVKVFIRKKKGCIRVEGFGK
ncbi:hypothetical protein JOD43_002614 [Pullulanibacillus pueri]|uniref:Glucosamine inositolphosphorylceramide transferase 1 N-terminal domain-containing protein n=1 Tax=Pullulanibacillus pueri TaxID=1437324 RepID=A0A8J3ELM4_9BACL|nr:hypothetical protein [Pullulanibacillus pueri]MBM7682437.1 hypothetical protein [Pullulanibacillus pueri]GGH81643.1 hypothetical protein GCM10007096_19840 [Pullulanibacillus pueri]